VVRDRCKTCGGEGVVTETNTLSVKVPAGVANGNFIPLRGMGDAGPHGGPAGDLIVVIEEKPHPLFERDGSDLLFELPVSLPTAVLGGRVETPALLGGSLSVEVPAGAQSGQVVRVRGRGLPSLRGGHGDALAHIRVWVPSRVSGPERKLLEELGRSENFKPPAGARSATERGRERFAP
jgi:molecular chaperone DnaJ